MHLFLLLGGEDHFSVDPKTGVVRTKGMRSYRPSKEYEIGVSAEDIAAPNSQKSITHSLKILVGERDPQFFERVYEANVPETAEEGFRYYHLLRGLWKVLCINAFFHFQGHGFL